MKRTLVFPEALGAGAADFAESATRGDELLEGARWVLERDAESGVRVWQDPPIYVLPLQAGKRKASRPGLSVFYTIAYDQVLVLSLGEGNAIPARNTVPVGIAAIGPEAHGY